MLDFNLTDVISSFSIENSSLITDKLFESTSDDTETEEDSTKISTYLSAT